MNKTKQMEQNAKIVNKYLNSKNNHKNQTEQ
jgi:hypothetical protein